VKSRPVAEELFHADTQTGDRQTDIMMLIVHLALNTFNLQLN